MTLDNITSMDGHVRLSAALGFVTCATAAVDAGEMNRQKLHHCETPSPSSSCRRHRIEGRRVVLAIDHLWLWLWLWLCDGGQCCCLSRDAIYSLHQIRTAVACVKELLDDPTRITTLIACY